MTDEQDETENDPWESFATPVYRAQAAQLVHESFKLTNSNAPNGGVRLGKDDVLDLPYLSARTLLKHGLSLDYVSNAGKTAKIAKQIRQAFSRTDQEAAQIREVFEAETRDRLEIGTAEVSRYQRQILIPMVGTYVAMTPLSAAGVAEKLSAAVRTHNDAVKQAWKQAKTPEDRAAITVRRIDLAIFGLGGSNPQNVGGLVRNMQRPLVFRAPTAQVTVKRTLALHYRGIALRFDRELMCGLRGWWNDAKAAAGGQSPADLQSRQTLQVFVERQVRELQARAAHTRELLQANSERLPHGADLVADGVSPEIRGLIDPTLRARGWGRAFAQLVAANIANHPFGDDKGVLDFDQADIDTIADIIEGYVR
jgi:hypothetical protein